LRQQTLDAFSLLSEQQFFPQSDLQQEEATLSLLSLLQSEQQAVLSPFMHFVSLAQHDFPFLSPQHDTICLPFADWILWRAQLWLSLALAAAVLSQHAHFAFSGVEFGCGFEFAVCAQAAKVRASIKAMVLYLIAESP
jgi:hypothetical protein